MKTNTQKYTILSTTNLISVTEKIEIETATDIFSLVAYRKNWFGQWKPVFKMWGFEGAAKELCRSLNDWLEIYDPKHDKRNQHNSNCPASKMAPVCTCAHLKRYS